MIVNLNDKISYLSDLSDRGFKEWLFNLLAQDMSEKVWFDPREPKHFQLRDIYVASEEALKGRFRDTLYDLLRGWSREFHTLEYFAKLIFLIGRLKVTEARDYLIQLADLEIEREEEDYEFKNYYVYPEDKASGEDVFRRILRAIFSFSPLEGKIIHLCEHVLRYEKSGRYAALCYRGLWEADKEKGIEYFPRMIDYYFSMPDYALPIELALSRFIEGNRQFLCDNIENLISPIIKAHSDNDSLKEFFDLLSRNSINFIQQKDVVVCYISDSYGRYHILILKYPHISNAVCTAEIGDIKEKLLETT